MTNGEHAKMYEHEGQPDVLAFITMVDTADIEDETLKHLVMAVRPLIAEIDARLVPDVDDDGNEYIDMSENRPYDERHEFTAPPPVNGYVEDACDRCTLPQVHPIHHKTS